MCFGALHVRVLLDRINGQMRIVGGFHMAIVLPSTHSFKWEFRCRSPWVAVARSNGRLVTCKGSLNSVDFARNPRLFEVEALGLVVCLKSFFVIQF